MKITSNIYAGLSAPERIRAAVSTMARDDDSELQILKDTCPKYPYLMTDPSYSTGMQKLFSMMLAVELDLTRYALDFQTARLRQGVERDKIQLCAIRDTAKAVRVMDKIIAEMGLDPEAVVKVFPVRHPFVAAIIKLSEDEDDLDLEEELQFMREYIAP